jgi:integrase
VLIAIQIFPKNEHPHLTAWFSHSQISAEAADSILPIQWRPQTLIVWDEAARRVVPVHPELKRIGFLDSVRTGTGSAGSRLFPNWKRGEDGYYSSGFSKWFARFLTSVDLKDPRLVFHSFRHGFKDALRRAMVEERIQDAIMGHDRSM